MKAFKNRLVEMVHYDKLGDFLLKASDVMDTDIPGNNQLTVHPLIDLGTSAEIIITSRKRNSRRIL